MFAPPQYPRARIIYQPQLEPDGVRHFDGSAVTLAARARAGETPRVYATGLGPVDPPASTGMPAADGASHRVVSPIDCAVSPDQQPVDLLAAVLAPGRVGIYELTVRLPNRFPAFTSVVTLNCRVHDEGGAFRILQANVPLEEL